MTLHTGATGQGLRRRARKLHSHLVERTSVEAKRRQSCAPASRISIRSTSRNGASARFPDVVTTTQVEQMISSGQGVRCPSDGRKPKRVAILLCVGSRDRQIGREWCSKICCTVSANMAMEIREELPDCHVYIYYMDIRTFGLYETSYYWRSQEEFKVKYIKARIAEVTSDGERLIVKGEDTLVKRPITIPFDMVVHAIGMDPNVDNLLLSSIFDVAAGAAWPYRPGPDFVRRDGPYQSRPGVFVAGAATGPETIDDSIAQANAAAIAAMLTALHDPAARRPA